jgi:hypothetical protein
MKQMRGLCSRVQNCDGFENHRIFDCCMPAQARQFRAILLRLFAVVAVLALPGCGVQRRYYTRSRVDSCAPHAVTLNYGKCRELPNRNLLCNGVVVETSCINAK